MTMMRAAAVGVDRTLLLLVVVYGVCLPSLVTAFVAAPVRHCPETSKIPSFATWKIPSPPFLPRHNGGVLLLRMAPDDRFSREIEEKSRRNAKQGAGEVAAGVILGGLLGGPFGALFGAQMGASFGRNRAIDRAKQEEMQRLGITPEMLEMARDAGAALERGFEGLKATRESLQTQQSFARRISNEADELYEKAQMAVQKSDEELARKYLFDRQTKQDKLKKTLLACAEEKKRLEKMEKNVEALEERAMEVESLLRRSVGAKSLQDTSNQFSLSDEDPLLRKFRDMGID